MSSPKGSSASMILFQGLKGAIWQHKMAGHLIWQKCVWSTVSSSLLSPEAEVISLFGLRGIGRIFVAQNLTPFPQRIIQFPGLHLLIRIWPFTFQAQLKIQTLYYCCNCVCNCRCCCDYDYHYDYYYWPVNSQSLGLMWLIISHQTDLLSNHKTPHFVFSPALSSRTSAVWLNHSLYLAEASLPKDAQSSSERWRPCSLPQSFVWWFISLPRKRLCLISHMDLSGFSFHPLVLLTPFSTGLKSPLAPSLLSLWRYILSWSPLSICLLIIRIDGVLRPLTAKHYFQYKNNSEGSFLFPFWLCKFFFKSTQQNYFNDGFITTGCKEKPHVMPYLQG